MRILLLSTCLLAVECVKERPRELLSLGDKAMERRSKRRILSGQDMLLDRFDSGHCIHKFETSTRTVVLAKESQENGAFFINETLSYSYKSCLKNCCETPGCNTAIWDQSTNFCYSFDCGTREDFKCLFDSHNMFTTGLLRVERSELDLESREYHRTRLQNLSPSRDQYSILTSQENEKGECGRYQFTCHTGECVAIYDVCNGIPQCQDGSDEDPIQCPSSTSASPPLTTLPLSPKPLSQTAFHHQNAGLQVAGGPYAYQPLLNQPFGYNYYGKPFSPAPQKQGEGGPTNEDSLKVKTLEKPEAGKAPQIPLNSTQDRTIAVKKKTPTDFAGSLITNSTLDRVEEMKNALLKDLKDADLTMETPSAAIFTLILGMTLTILLVLILACRIRGRRGGKRNSLLADADEDYLVNGMYL